jgi:chorismate dehydratase
MTRIRLGAVEYLNARPLVYGLDESSRFDVRYDIPSECARLLHARVIDVGLVPSIEYLRGPQPYAIAPGPAIASRGPVASVALYTTKPVADIRSIALDSSSRTSVALVTVLCAKRFNIQPSFQPAAPDLPAMLAASDAALIIGDNALLLDHGVASQQVASRQVEKIDLGEVWTAWTGLPFVYAVWTGWPGALDRADVAALERVRDEGVANAAAVARAYFPKDPARQAIGERYLRDNIHYTLGAQELEGLRLFYRYAAEVGLARFDGSLRFYDADTGPDR